MEAISYKLNNFEGPMDLLLLMISKRKLSINEVPIFELIEQYLNFVHQMKEENLDLASEFLGMAARLVYIKTVSLLPVHEEADRLAEELRGELTEYLDCKMVAEKLSGKAKGFDFFFRIPQQFPVDMTYKRRHEPVEIFKAYMSAVGKGMRKLPPPAEAFSEIVERKVVSITSRISFVLSRLSKTGKEKFLSLFEKSETRSEMVATFLALLALVKAKRIKVDGAGEKSNITLIKTSKGLKSLEHS